MQTTTPDAIAYPDTSDLQNTPNIGSVVASSIQTALLLRQVYEYRWSGSTPRSTQTGMRTGDMGVQYDTLTVYVYDGTIWRPIAGQMPWLNVTVSAQTISTATVGVTAVALNTITLQRGDISTFFTFSSNQITILVAGVYRIYFGVEFAGTTSTDQGRRQARFMVNGTTLMNADGTSNSTSGQGTTVSNFYMRSCLVGDIITLGAGLTSSVSPQSIALPGTYLVVEYVGV